MDRIRTAVLAALSGMFLFVAFISQGHAAPSVENFFRSEGDIHDVVLSPDGKHLAMVRIVQGERRLMIYRLSDKGELGLTNNLNSSEKYLRDLHWVSNERLLFTVQGYDTETGLTFTDKGRVYQPMLVAINTDGTRPAILLTGGKEFRFAFERTNVISYLRDDPDHVLMAVAERKRSGKLKGVHVYKVNVNTGEATLAEEGSVRTVSWYADYQGNLRVRKEAPLLAGDTDYIYWIRTEPGAEWTEFMRHSWREEAPFMPLSFSTDPGILYIRAPLNGDRYAIFEFDVRTRKRGRVVFSHPDVDVEGGVYSTEGGDLIGARYILDKPQYALFDESRKSLQDKLNRSFGKYDTPLAVSWSRDLRRVVLRVSGPKQPGTYYLYDTQTGHAGTLGAVNPALASASLGEMRPVSYRSRDRLKIRAYLTTPPGNPPRPPLVVMPHGGPAARDWLEWDTWAQFLATRGYAVLQPNFRGSTGYGKKFEEAGFKQWGLKMQDDITDGVNHVIEQGLVDGSRVCIMGASYGGYAALAGAAFTPDLYRCAVSINGISDVESMLGHDRREGNAYVQYWSRALGDVFNSEDMKRAEATSPVRHVAQIKAAILLIAGEWDSNVPAEQSETLARALRRADKPHEYHEFEKEGHTIIRLSNRRKLARLVEAFLYKHIGSKPDSP